jgi:hypothetical protein
VAYSVDQLGVFDTMDEALAAIKDRNVKKTAPVAKKPAEKPREEED